jgi:O-succinylbenzoate synthase
VSQTQLVGLELVRVSLPLVEPWVSGAGSFAARDSMLVRAVVRGRAYDGQPATAEGWGECPALPAPTYSSEYTEGALAVSEAFLVPCLLGSQPTCWGQAARAMAEVRGHGMAKTAFEVALTDAWLRLEGNGVSFAHYLSALAAEREGGRHGYGHQLGEEPRTAVPAGVAVGLCCDRDELLARVNEHVGAGYRRVKLKVKPGWDIVPLAAVRERWPELVLFADANGGYADSGIAGAASQLVGLDELALGCLEQPLADDDLVGHAELARKLRSPICLDEALISVGGLVAALDIGACSVVNVKPGRFGGYHEAVRAYGRCRARGVRMWCGGMVETGIGRAANLALASLSGFDLPGDLSASERFFAEDVAGPFVLRADGTIAVPDGAGLGTEIFADVIDRYCTWRKWRAV